MNAVDRTASLLAAAEGASAATTDMIDCARNNGDLRVVDNIGSGDTLCQMVDSLRLLIDCMPTPDEDINQLQGAVIRFLEERI